MNDKEKTEKRQCEKNKKIMKNDFEKDKIMK